MKKTARNAKKTGLSPKFWAALTIFSLVGQIAWAVYTQLSDVEDETNGLFTYDRRVCKADEARMRSIAAQLQTKRLSG